MHPTSLIAGQAFSEIYGGLGKIVLDIGGRDENGSLRSFFETKGMKFICIDISQHPSVDIVIKAGDKLPFDNNSIDLIVSSSCFEHDPCFWLTFKEMTRIIKSDGFIYINAPTTGVYHNYPGDNWRFYSDAGQALAYWSGKQLYNEEVFPVKIEETFHIIGPWHDFVCVWKRTNNKEENITVQPEILNNIGVLEKTINSKNYKTVKKCNIPFYS
jgi:SAM-dependent methyltransferase